MARRKAPGRARTKKVKAQQQEQQPAPPGEPPSAAAGEGGAGWERPFVRTPPQSEGIEPRPYLVGGPARIERIGIALRVLGDPVARTSFSRVYSGQTTRRWG
jgi:hypothetical protein